MKCGATGVHDGKHRSSRWQSTKSENLSVGAVVRASIGVGENGAEVARGVAEAQTSKRRMVRGKVGSVEVMGGSISGWMDTTLLKFEDWRSKKEEKKNRSMRGGILGLAHFLASWEASPF